MEEISHEISSYSVQVSAYIVGGMAVSWWVGSQRKSFDVDAIFSHRFAIPNISKKVNIENREKYVIFDHNFNESFSLLQKDYQDRATHVAKYTNLNIFVLSPVDLVIMKASRYTENDQKDIEELIKLNLVDQNKFETLFNDALIDYIGNPTPLMTNLELITRIFEKHNTKNQEKNQIINKNQKEKYKLK